MQNNVLDYIEESLKRVPDKIAYADDEVELSFARVKEIMDGVGTGLIERGLNREPVVVFMKKSPNTIATFFGVINAGCYYVPIDSEMPATRINLILDNCKPKVIICDQSTMEIGKGFDYQGDIVLFDDIASTKANHERLAAVRAKAIDTDPIYIVFTSGSTGVPKGVVACHRSVIDYIEQLSDTLGFDENTIFGNQTPLYFDACLKELYPTLKFGATTYLIPHSYFMFPVKLVEYINEHKINTVCWVVSALTMISAFNTFDTVKPETLRTIAFGSEVFPIKQFRLWRQACPEAKFFNLYGPTEGTGMCCYYPVERDFADDEVIPVGFPFKNTEILLLKDDNTLAAQGEQGEICIRGTSVTLGYFNNPEKTSESYVQNPLNHSYPEIIYRTGDMGHINERGELVFHSRKDFQIKHMGHRIELGEIEANVNLVPEIKLSGCIYAKDQGKIILFYVGDIGEGDLIKALKTKLPRYMLPNKVIKLEEMPFTANGKIDRVTLSKMY
ncbi:MAG: amino acid adenylation domain-containing protein [Pseudobutyrivibrio sp.]|nr:amino acid adenylation domain-containing protein [Pseudobutyrivibrio sp.]